MFFTSSRSLSAPCFCRCHLSFGFCSLSGTSGRKRREISEKQLQEEKSQAFFPIRPFFLRDGQRLALGSASDVGCSLWARTQQEFGGAGVFLVNPPHPTASSPCFLIFSL